MRGMRALRKFKPGAARAGSKSRAGTDPERVGDFDEDLAKFASKSVLEKGTVPVGQELTGEEKRLAAIPSASDLRAMAEVRRAFPEEGDFGGYDAHEYGRFWWIT